MKYKVCGDNIYRTRFMRETEELMDKLTVKEFIEYLKDNALLESKNEDECICGRLVRCKVYALTESNSNLVKEFLVTEDGRLFYWASFIKKVELIDG